MPKINDVKINLFGTFPIWAILCAVLVVLKLTGYVEIGWLWVFCPLWGPIASVLAVLFAGLLIAGVVVLCVLVSSLVVSFVKSFIKGVKNSRRRRDKTQDN